MFRITRADYETQSVLTVEGKLSGDCVDTLDTCCRQALARGVTVCLHLREVTDIDAPVQALLRKLAAIGVRLRGSGIYTSWVLRELNGGDTPATGRTQS